MRRNLILHVGSPKCGSTYLQQVLLRNRARLEAQGIAYAHEGDTHPGNGLMALDITPDWTERVFRGLPRAVLSHEDLFAAAGRAHPLAALTRHEGIKVHIVAFLRPFSAFLFGDYSQFIKQHLERYISEGRAFEGRGFEQFAVDRARALNAKGFLNGWAALFPETPLTLASHRQIRPVIEARLDVRGLDWTVPKDRTNPSLRMADCDAIVAALNAGTEPPDAIRARLRGALARAGQPDPGKTEERIAWIEALFSHQNAALLAAFGLDNRLTTKTGAAGHAKRVQGDDPLGNAQRRTNAGGTAEQLPAAAAQALAPDRVG